MTYLVKAETSELKQAGRLPINLAQTYVYYGQSEEDENSLKPVSGERLVDIDGRGTIQWRYDANSKEEVFAITPYDQNGYVVRIKGGSATYEVDLLGGDGKLKPSSKEAFISAASGTFGDSFHDWTAKLNQHLSKFTTLVSSIHPTLTINPSVPALLILKTDGHFASITASGPQQDPPLLFKDQNPVTVEQFKLGGAPEGKEMLGGRDAAWRLNQMEEVTHSLPKHVREQVANILKNGGSLTIETYPNSTHIVKMHKHSGPIPQR